MALMRSPRATRSVCVASASGLARNSVKTIAEKRLGALFQ